LGVGRGGEREEKLCGGKGWEVQDTERRDWGDNRGNWEYIIIGGDNMKRYNILIFIDRESDEILFITEEGKCKLGISKIDGDRLYDRVWGSYHDLREILNSHDGKEERFLELIDEDNRKKEYKLLSGGEDYIIEEIRNILSLMEII